MSHTIQFSLGNDAGLSDKWVTVYQFMQCIIPEDFSSTFVRTSDLARW